MPEDLVLGRLRRDIIAHRYAMDDIKPVFEVLQNQYQVLRLIDQPVNLVIRGVRVIDGRIKQAGLGELQRGDGSEEAVGDKARYVTMRGLLSSHIIENALGPAGS